MFQPKEAGRLAIGTLNVRRLSSTDRLVELQQELRGINIDVLALTELRWRGTGCLDLSDSEFRFYHADDSQDVSGTGFLDSRRTQPFVEAFNKMTPRISKLDLKFGRQVLRLYAVYAPPTTSTSRGAEDDDEEDAEEDYESLLETLRSELGRTGCPLTGARRTSATALGSHNACSDHRLVRAIIQTPGREALHHEEKKPKERHRLNRDLYRMALNIAPPVSASPTTSSGYANLAKIIHEAAEFAREDVRREPRLSPNTEDLLKQRRVLKNRRSTATDRIAFTEFNKMVRREIRKDLVKHHQRLVEEAVESNRGLRTVRREAATGRRRLIRLRDNDGNVCTTTTDLQRTVKDFYETLYSSTVRVEFNEPESADECPVLLQSEVEEALRKMKNRTAPGIDNITVEMMKLGKDVLVPELTKLFNACLQTSSMPKKMGDSSTILLFKKDDPLDLQNYRPISLLSCVYKLLTKVLNQRIERVLDSEQPVEQAGFRKNFSTTDHLHAVNELVERSREYRLPLFILFVDYEKAFDSVETNAVWNAIQQQGVPAQIIKLLQKIYSEARSLINIADRLVPIEIRRGVRQGDTISPKLFTATLEHVFRQLQWDDVGININGSRLSNLRFADDVALIADNAQELQKMLDELDEASRRFGLKINARKTKMMTTEEATILLNGREIDQVEFFIYLGQEVRLLRDHSREINSTRTF
ncbi:hypothetical protein QR680_014205 [Steinernema hermaphroditum]|uniref:Reverse transcriptase domain-containing protein n=1 Tax=Steinernema hermaphroditum TaxID=289476 RepID=A0AA39M2T2_9BILA|nr:hypothetical protein QR680_014205 [Steinernema hermaphroditum]